MKIIHKTYDFINHKIAELISRASRIITRQIAGTGEIKPYERFNISCFPCLFSQLFRIVNKGYPSCPANGPAWHVCRFAYGCVWQYILPLSRHRWFGGLEWYITYPVQKFTPTGK